MNTGSYGKCRFNFTKTKQNDIKNKSNKIKVSKVAELQYIRAPVAPHFCQHLVLSGGF